MIELLSLKRAVPPQKELFPSLLPVFPASLEGAVSHHPPRKELSLSIPGKNCPLSLSRKELSPLPSRKELPPEKELSPSASLEGAVPLSSLEGASTREGSSCFPLPPQKELSLFLLGNSCGMNYTPPFSEGAVPLPPWKELSLSLLGRSCLFSLLWQELSPSE